MFSPSAPPGFSMNGNYAESHSTGQALPMMDALRQEYQLMKEGENRRHEFVETLMSAIQTLTSDKEDALRKLARAEFTCDSYQDRLNSADKKINELKKATDCDRFVITLIDGDVALFLDAYIKEGGVGGDRAARDLRQAIFDYLKDRPDFQHDYNVLIRVYLNLQGLSRTYSEAKLISNSKLLFDFVQAFNKSHDLVEIVDAGNDKEAADRKIQGKYPHPHPQLQKLTMQASFKLFQRNVQCKHILFAGSGDNSYAGFLRRYMPTEGQTHNITLIEALPFTNQVLPLVPAFQHANFPRIFRASKLVVQHSAVQEPVIPTRNWDTNTASWAASLRESLPPAPDVIKENIPPPTAALAPRPSPLEKPAVTLAEKVPFIYQNKYGQRVDKPVSESLFDQTLVQKLKDRKMCNKYWLGRGCNAQKCRHDHSGKLSLAEMENLRYVARFRACFNGLNCADPLCFDGHRCPNGPRCFHKDKDCKFAEYDMHDVEHEGVVKVPVESYEEGWGEVWCVKGGESEK